MTSPRRPTPWLMWIALVVAVGVVLLILWGGRASPRPAAKAAVDHLMPVPDGSPRRAAG